MIEVNSDILQKRIKESELFSNRFGTFSKSDYEILMFTIYLDSVKKNVRDYDISLALGIPESKVRNLRIKSQLLYPREINWIDDLKDAVDHGYYDPVSGHITVTIEDPCVRNIIKNEVESNFGMVSLTLNSKQLVLPIESYLMLATISEKDPDRVLDKLNEFFKRNLRKRKRLKKEHLRIDFLKKYQM